jgi:hypothetical protein
LHFRTLTRAAKVAAVAALASAAIPGAASAATTGPVCAPQTTKQAFILFGDLRDYYLAPGGAFEGSVSWAGSGAVSLAASNDPWFLAGIGHKSSARLGFGASITSPKLCVSRNEPFARFVAKSSGSGQLDVTVRVYHPNGYVIGSSSGSVSPSAHARWAPSELIDLQTSSWPVGQTGYVDVSFRSRGDWHVDDVFVDPYRR